MVEAEVRLLRHLRQRRRRVRPRAVRDPPGPDAPAHRPGAAGHARPRVLGADHGGGRRRDGGRGGRPRGRRRLLALRAVRGLPSRASTTSARRRGSIGLCLRRRLRAAGALPRLRGVPLADEVSDEAGALLEPLAVGLHALDRGGARAGERVVVLGYGPIGACTAAVAAAMGLEVLVSEPDPGRRARARTAGLRRARARRASRARWRKQVRERPAARRQIVVDCSGVPAALEAAPDMTVRGGRSCSSGCRRRRRRSTPARSSSSTSAR